MRSEAEIREALGFIGLLLTDTSHATSDTSVIVAEKIFQCLSWILKEQAGEPFEEMISKLQKRWKVEIEAILRAQRQ